MVEPLGLNPSPGFSETLSKNSSLVSPENRLAFEISDECASAALILRGDSLSNIFSISQTGRGVSLIDLIDRLLSSAGISKAEIEALFISNGPTSFTALRVSHAVAKALKIGLRIPVYGISRLHAFAMMAQDKGFREFQIIQESYKNQIYAGRFLLENQIPRLQGKIECLPPGDFFKKISPETQIINCIKRPKRSLLQGSEKFLLSEAPEAAENLAIGVLSFFLFYPKPDPEEFKAAPFYSNPPEAVIHYEKKFGAEVSPDHF